MLMTHNEYNNIILSMKQITPVKNNEIGPNYDRSSAEDSLRP